MVIGQYFLPLMTWPMEVIDGIGDRPAPSLTCLQDNDVIASSELVAPVWA
jgi:hypothetical protein